jgi:hypothetical protein
MSLEASAMKRREFLSALGLGTLVSCRATAKPDAAKASQVKLNVDGMI